MTNLTDLWRERLLDWLTGASPSGSRYAALLAEAPATTDTGSTIVEVDYDDYERLAVAFGATVDERRKNSVELVWAAPLFEVEVAGVAIVTASSGGELVGFDEFLPTVVIEAGQAPKFTVNTLALALAGAISAA